MCGIVGYIGKRKAYPILIKGLKRLEYRGYDSAGVALISDNQQLNVYKTKGKVSELENFVTQKDISGTAGIAHTYIAKEKLENAAKELGDSIKVETQGSIGVENELTLEEIKDADVILISADIRVNKDRFKGKAVVDIPISTVMKSPKGVLNKIHEKLGK